MPTLPTGTITFLFTDIEGSSRLLEQLKDAYADVLVECRRMLRTAVQERGGQEVDTEGDAVFAAFPSARAALMAAVSAQLHILHHPWPDGTAVRVRMGLHTGEARRAEAGYVGIDVHRAARICAAAHGGQILLSDTTSALVTKDLPEGVNLRDLGEHRLKDLAHPHRLFEALAPDLPADFPPLRSLDAHTHNLPIQLTSFIGRAREIADVKRLLAGARLVTLTGAGGAGKTRLALQVAADVLEEYPGGVWLAELAPIADPALVPKIVASALNVPEQPGRGMTETLMDALRLKTVLLVLDNCEHLLAACADLATALLRACPQGRILTTSREALGVPGEMLWRVPSLSLPDAGRVPTVEDLVLYEAVRLFADRAMATAPGFAVTRENAPVVAQVCRRLDGIPLAIELAAARVKVLAVEQIATRLDDRFRLLIGGSRIALPRHQTLRAAIDWSYNLLSETERVLLRRLSVFAGGWALEAAESVCANGGVEASSILDLLASLVDKSLVLAEIQRGEARYRLLETVRQYASDRLLEAGEETEARRRHRDWVLALAEEAEPKLRGPEQSLWVKRLELEHDNLRAGLEWSISEVHGAEAALRLVWMLLWFWSFGNHQSEGRRWAKRALEASSGATSSARARALTVAGTLAWAQGDNPVARSLLHEAVAVFRGLGDKHGLAYALQALSLAQGDYVAAHSAGQDALMLFREIGDRWGLALAAYSLGTFANNEGHHAMAHALHLESLSIFRELGDKWGIARPLRGLGLVAYRQGDYAAARSLLGQSLALRREVEDKRSIALALRDLGDVAWKEGDCEAALAYFKESTVLSQEVGDKRHLAKCFKSLARIAVARGSHGRGARLYGAADILPPVTAEHTSFGMLQDDDSDMAALRAALGEVSFTVAWGEGRAMTLEQAIEFALAAENGRETSSA